MVDTGESLPDKIGALVPDVEIHARIPALFELAVNGSGDDVSRGQFLVGMVDRHEGGAVGELQNPSFAANGLRDEEGFRLGVIEARRMKLDKFHIGDCRARAVGHRHTVAGDDIRV